MRIQVSGKHIDMSPALISHASSTLEKLFKKYTLEPLNGDVLFSKEGHIFVADISVNLIGSVRLRAHGEAETAYESLDKGSAKLEQKVRKYKNRLAHHHKHRDSPIQKHEALDRILGNEKADVPGEEHPPIIAEMITDIPTLSVGDAVMRIDLADLPILLFKNSKGDFNVVYRRSDGNIGWILPKLPSEKPRKGPDPADLE